MRDVIHSAWIRNFLLFFRKQKNVHFISNSMVTAQAMSLDNPVIIYNGFDQEEFKPGPSTLKEELEIPKSSQLVAIVGVIAHWKGQRQFLKMAEKLQSKNSDLHFLIVGDEIYDTSGENGELALLKNLTKELSLKNVHFMGFQKNIQKIYTGIDLLIHGSIKPEPFGRVIVEAMLCECPVLAANQGGPIEIIESGISGMLYKSGHLNDLTDKATNLLNDSSLRQSISQEARQRALKFSMASYVKAMDEQLNIF